MRDLRQHCGLRSLPYGPTTVVVALRMPHDHGSRVMGLVVEAGSDVYQVSDAEMQPPPACGGAVSMACVQSLATVGEKLRIMLVPAHLLLVEE